MSVSLRSVSPITFLIFVWIGKSFRIDSISSLTNLTASISKFFPLTDIVTCFNVDKAGNSITKSLSST